MLRRLLKLNRQKLPQLPLKPRGISSKHTIYGAVPPDRVEDCRAIIAAGIKRTPADAWHFLAKHPDIPLRKLIREYKPRRKSQPLARAWRRFRALWIVVVLFAVGMAMPVQAQSVVTLKVLALKLNVRSGPGLTYPAFAVLDRGTEIAVEGFSRDRKFVAIEYQGQRGFVTALRAYVQLRGDLISLPLIDPARLSVVATMIDPPVPTPGQPFTIFLTLKNEGADTLNAFAIATAFDGGSFASATVQRLAAAQSVIVALANPSGEFASGPHTIRVALDLDNALGLDQPTTSISYLVDRRADYQQIRVEANSMISLCGVNDLAFDGAALTPLVGGAIAQLDASQAEMHAGLIQPALSNPEDRIVPEAGKLIAVQCAGGQLAYLRVMQVSGDIIQIGVWVYR